jgi:hypothetical protein
MRLWPNGEQLTGTALPRRATKRADMVLPIHIGETRVPLSHIDVSLLKSAPMC